MMQSLTEHDVDNANRQRDKRERHRSQETIRHLVFADAASQHRGGVGIINHSLPAESSAALYSTVL